MQRPPCTTAALSSGSPQMLPVFVTVALLQELGLPMVAIEFIGS